MKAEIVFPSAPTAFSYAVKNLEVAVGDLVAAKIRGKLTNGIVAEIHDRETNFEVQPLAEVVRQNVLADWQVDVTNWLIKNYAGHAGRTFRLFVPERVFKNDPLKRKVASEKITSTPQPEKKLTDEQTAAIKKIEKSEKPVLLHGITGSGKTEIHLRLVESAIAAEKQAILLVPEIALTPQLVGYFAATIPPEKIAVLHSQLSAGARLEAWEKIHAGEIKLVIGSRSALFAPAKNLSLVILDEEHENSYKNDSSPRYHARRVAEKICELTKSKLVLGSATPSFESYAAAKAGRFKLVELPNRVGGGSLPAVSIADMRNEIKRQNYSIFSETLREKISDRLAKKEQIILLLNRRGYAPAIVCRDCGEVLRCRDCSLPLVFHRTTGRCLCHACGFFRAEPRVCESCGSAKIRQLGSGTEKLEEEIGKLFPAAKVLRADRDTTSARGAHAKIFEEFRSGDADILVGTQIVAKGLDFPNVSLVGVLLADSGLFLPDFRAGERTFALLTQAAGRAGRADSRGEVVIQTYAPENPAIRAAATHDFQKFFATEISERKKLFWPPFSRVLTFEFSDRSESAARRLAENFAAEIKKTGEKNVAIAPAAHARVRNLFRWNVLVRTRDPQKLLAAIDTSSCRVDLE